VHRVTYFLSAAPLFWISWRLFNVWVRPEAIEDAQSWVRFGVALLLLEFVLLHSGVFVVVGFAWARTWGQRLLVMLGITVFYGLFVVGFALGTESRQVLEIYGFVLVGRFATLVVNRDSGGAMILARSLLGTLIYLPLGFASVLVPWPRFGLVGEYAAAARTPGASGIWVEDPHRAIAMAAIYFLLMGVVEIMYGLQAGDPASADA
jgi:hypothetical protein